MEQEPEHKLEDWLDAYKVADADPALLDRIVTMAAVTPQQAERRAHLPAWVQSWGAHAAALAVIALLGFWIGNGSFPKSANTVSTRQTFLSGESYLDEIIFGPKTWQEVSL